MKKFDMKIVAIDFDETITDNESCWLSVMTTLEKFGYQVIVVTYRKPDAWPEDLQFLVNKGYKVYFTGQVSKQKFMSDLGIKVDIWIDDEPKSITMNYNTTNWTFEPCAD